MYDFAQKISHLRFGWMILGAMLSASLCTISFTQAHIPTVLISFPPCIGHTTTVTLCGFAYGMKGFYIAAAGSVLGSAIVFVVLRLLFSKRLRSWSSSNEKWQALEAVIVRLLKYSAGLFGSSAQRARGLPLIMLIRASPFPPWVYANSLFAVSGPTFILRY